MCKRIIYSLSVIFLMAVGFYGGTKAEEYLTVKEAGKSTIGTIAVVNLDEGVMIEEEKVNYAAKLIAYPDTNFIMTSLADARNGIKTDKYAAYIIIPGTFSRSVVSVNTKPEKANIEYAVNDNLREDIMVKVVGDINNFNLSLSSNMAYMYVSAILEEFHSAQDTADTIMENDNRDAELVSSVAPDALLTNLQFTELKQTESHIKPLDLDSRYHQAGQTVDAIDAEYQNYIEKGKEEFETIKAGQAKVVQAVAEADKTIAEIDIEKSGDGEVVYQKGVEKLDDVLEARNQEVEEHQNLLKSLLGTSEVSSFGKERNSTDVPEPELKSVQESVTEHNNEVNSQIEEIQAQIEIIEKEISKPTVVPIEPPTTHPTEPPTTEPTEPPTTEPIEPSTTEPTEPSSQDLSEKAAEEAVEENTGNEEAIKEQTVRHTTSAQSAKRDMLPPPDMTPPPGKEPIDKEKIKTAITGIHEKLDAIEPVDITKELKNIEKEVMAIPGLEIAEVTPVIQEDIIAPIQEECKKEATMLTGKTDAVKIEMDTYEKSLLEYDPLKYVDQGSIDSRLSDLGSNITGMELEITKSNSEYLEEVGQVYTDTNDNITALQNNMDIMYEETGKNIINAVESLKQSRNTINKQNVIILSDLTQKLPYTRLGSVEFTEAYDFIVNPVSVENKGSNVTIQVKHIQDNPKDRVQIILVIICAVTGGGILILLTISKIRDGKQEEKSYL